MAIRLDPQLGRDIAASNAVAAGEFRAPLALSDPRFSLDPEPEPQLTGILGFGDTGFRGIPLNQGTIIGRSLSAVPGGFMRRIRDGGLGVSREFFEEHLDLGDNLPAELLEEFLRGMASGPVGVLDITDAVVVGLLEGFGQTLVEAGLDVDEARAVVAGANVATMVAGGVSLAAGVPRMLGRLRTLSQKALAQAANTPGKLADNAAESVELARQNFAIAATGQMAGNNTAEARFGFFTSMKNKYIDNITSIRATGELAGLPREEIQKLEMSFRRTMSNEGFMETMLEYGPPVINKSDEVFLARAPNNNVVDAALNVAPESRLGYMSLGRNLERTGELAEAEQARLAEFILNLEKRGLQQKKPDPNKFLPKDADGRVFLTPEGARATLRDIDPDGTRFADIKKRFQENDDFDLDFWEDSDLFSPERRQAIADLNVGYVNLSRLLTGDEVVEGARNVLARRTGRGSDAAMGSVMGNLIRNKIAMYQRALENRRDVRFFSLVDEMSEGEKIAVPVEAPPIKELRIADKRVEDVLKEHNLSLDQVPEDVIRVFAGNGGLPKDVRVFFKNGKAQYRKIINKDILETYESLGPRTMPFLWKAFGIPRAVVTGIVTRTPTFLTTTFSRAQTEAVINTRRRLHVPLVDAIRGQVGFVRRDANYNLARLNFVADFSSRRSGLHERNVSALYLSGGVDREKQILDTPRKIMDAVLRVMDSFEMGGRLSEFGGLRKRGENLSLAALSARRIESDLSRHGAHIGFARFASTVPFLNARLQGLANIAEQARERPLSVLPRALATFTMPAAALYLMNRDDPRWGGVQDWFKDTHFVFFLPGVEQPVGIPNGFEYGALFHAIPTRFLEFLEHQNGRKFTGHLARILAENLNLLPIPAAIKPIAESGIPATDFKGMNFSLFTGARILSPDLERVETTDQFKPWTSATLVAMSKALEEHTNGAVQLSPARMENLLRGYFSGLAMTLLDLMDTTARLDMGLGAEPDKRLAEFPILRGLMEEAVTHSPPWMDDAFDIIVENRKFVATQAKMKREGRIPRTLSEQQLMLDALSPAIEALDDQLGTIRRQMTLVAFDRSLSGRRKTEIMTQLMSAMNELARDFVEGVESRPNIAEALGL